MAILSCPIAVTWKKKPTPISASIQAVVGSDKVLSEAPLLQNKQSQFPQSILVRLVLWTLLQHCCMCFDPLQHISVFLIVRGSKLYAYYYAFLLNLRYESTFRLIVPPAKNFCLLFQLSLRSHSHWLVFLNDRNNSIVLFFFLFTIFLVFYSY